MIIKLGMAALSIYNKNRHFKCKAVHYILECSAPFLFNCLCVD